MKQSVAPVILVCSFKDEEVAAPIFISDLLTTLEFEKKIFKLILADDGSSDQTSKVLEKFVCSNVELLTLRSNIGKIAAQAVGARKFKDESSDLIFLTEIVNITF